ncbi:MAG: hypothetical protein AAFO29_19835, partial [Actinomycetota bacterium]
MTDDPMTPVDHDGPVAEFITEVTTGAPIGPFERRRRTGRNLALGALIGAMAVAGAWVALPGRSGAPSAPIPLPAYGEALPRQELDLTVGEALPDEDLRLVVFGLQPGFSPSDPELLSIGPDGVDRGQLGSEVWWGVQFGEQPGIQRGLVVAAAGSMVVTSGGRVVAQDVGLVDPAIDLGPGISVLPGASADTVWVVTSAGRRVRLVTVPSGMEVVNEPIERGRPLAGGPIGLVLAPEVVGQPF